MRRKWSAIRVSRHRWSSKRKSWAGCRDCSCAARADETARRAYLKRFPYAALAELTLWAIRPDYMKLTDNTLGFGKKLIWNDKLESSS